MPVFLNAPQSDIARLGPLVFVSALLFMVLALPVSYPIFPLNSSVFFI